MWEPIRKWLDESKYGRSVFIFVFTSVCLTALALLLSWAREGHTWVIWLMLAALGVWIVKYWDA